MIQMKNSIAFLFSVILFVSLMIVMTSCSKQVAFQISPVAPAARGDVSIKLGKNENYHIKLNISNLAEVSRMKAPNKTYVIWLQTPANDYKNIGQLESSTTMVSSKLKASFETYTAFKPTKIFITAEESGSVYSPGSNLILTTNRF
jgi:hypothetical protein